MNSLIITLDNGTTVVYECHTYTQAMNILAGQATVTPVIASFELV